MRRAVLLSALLLAACQPSSLTSEVTPRQPASQQLAASRVADPCATHATEADCQAACIHRVEAVDVLVGIDREQDMRRIDVPG